MLECFYIFRWGPEEPKIRSLPARAAAKYQLERVFSGRACSRSSLPRYAIPPRCPLLLCKKLTLPLCLTGVNLQSGSGTVIHALLEVRRSLSDGPLTAFCAARAGADAFRLAGQVICGARHQKPDCERVSVDGGGFRGALAEKGCRGGEWTRCQRP